MPAGTRRELLTFRAVYTASGVAGNRFPTLTLDDGTATPYANIWPNPVALTVGQTAPYSFQQGGPNVTGQTGFQAGLPINNRLGAGHRIQTVTSGKDVGDTWTLLRYLVREWLTAD
jgi:hypothetical protein